MYICTSFVAHPGPRNCIIYKCTLYVYAYGWLVLADSKVEAQLIERYWQKFLNKFIFIMRLYMFIVPRTHTFVISKPESGECHYMRYYCWQFSEFNRFSVAFKKIYKIRCNWILSVCGTCESVKYPRARHFHYSTLELS